ncbi:hypothetical protein [Moorena sp. SIO3H5]|nr:hypothetical protein [Moorena sp. SIO3H5]
MGRWRDGEMGRWGDRLLHKDRDLKFKYILSTITKLISYYQSL